MVDSDRGDRKVARALVIVVSMLNVESSVCQAVCVTVLCSQSHSSAIKDTGPRYPVMSNQTVILLHLKRQEGF